MTKVAAAATVAAADGRVDVAKKLIAYNAVVGLTDENGMTPLHFAAKFGHSGLVNMLLDHGATLEHASKDGRTALHFACTGGHMATVQLLVSSGAKLSAKDSSGKAALQLAQESGHEEILGFLRRVIERLPAGADCLPPAQRLRRGTSSADQKPDAAEDRLAPMGAVPNATNLSRSEFAKQLRQSLRLDNAKNPADVRSARPQSKHNGDGDPAHAPPNADVARQHTPSGVRGEKGAGDSGQVHSASSDRHQHPVGKILSVNHPQLIHARARAHKDRCAETNRGIHAHTDTDLFAHTHIQVHAHLSQNFATTVHASHAHSGTSHARHLSKQDPHG